MTEISLAPLITREFVDSLTPLQRVMLAYRNDVWARPEQRVPAGDWRWLFLRAGRGWGKTTHCVAPEITRLVMSGACTCLALVAPSEERSDQIQIQALIDASPPWFRAERYAGGIRWPNGVRGYVFSPGANAPRGSTFSHGWASELVDWGAPKQMEHCWQQLLITVRKPGSEQKIFVDSTASGRNIVFQKMEQQNAADPVTYPIVHGTSFDNPLLSAKYLRDICAQYPKGSRRFREEVMGESFQEAAGALWKAQTIDDNRRPNPPTNVRRRVVAWDPSGSGRVDADEAGISCASADETDFYVEHDQSMRGSTGEQAEVVFALAIRTRSAGIVLERSGLNDGPRDLLALIAQRQNVRLERLEHDRPMPEFRSGVLYLRELVATRSKAVRAEPIAKIAEEGRLHHVGYHDALELEMTTWEPDTRASPNRLDAAVYAVAELAALSRPRNTFTGDAAAARAGQELLSARLREIGRARTI
jgi:phage terminase large subunit-like protein